MNSESDFPRTSTRLRVPHRFGRDPGQQQARQVAVGELVAAARDHVEREWPVDALVLFAVAGVASRQGAERQHPRHEAEVGVRFAGPDQQVYLIGNGEAPLCRGRGVADRLHGAAHTGEGITDRNQLAALSLHGFILPCVSDSPTGDAQSPLSIDLSAGGWNAPPDIARPPAARSGSAGPLPP